MLQTLKWILITKKCFFAQNKFNFRLSLGCRKYYIYKSKFSLERISILGLKAFLKIKFEEEKYIAKINNKHAKFLGRWSSLYTVLNM